MCMYSKGSFAASNLSDLVSVGLPLLGPEPELCQLYSTKSGARRIFRDAQVSVITSPSDCIYSNVIMSLSWTLQVAIPPSEGDIFSEEQLVERLASLVTAHPLIPRWLFKLPEHICGRGFGETEDT